MKIDFVGQAYTARSKLIDCQECVNLYPELEQGTSKNVSALIGTPGLVKVVTNEYDGYCRGLFSTVTNRKFAVLNDKFIEFKTSGSKSVRGALNTTSGQVVFAQNDYQIMLVDGKFGYIFNLDTNEFVQITDENFPNNCSHVRFIDGRFVINTSNPRLPLSATRYSGNMYWSALYNGLVWDALEGQKTVEGSPDTLDAIGKINNQLYCFGARSLEVHYDSGNADIGLFVRVDGAFFDIGISARYSLAENGDALFWLGNSTQGYGQVYMCTNIQPQRISTHGIEYIINSAPRIDDAIGYTYQEEGHRFYVLCLPTAKKTLCFDMSTGLWHERASYNETKDRDEMHQVTCTCFADGFNYAGSFSNGNIYKYDLDKYTDDGASIRRVRSTMHIHNNRLRLFFKKFEVDMERGTALQNGQGSDPKAVLQWSDDGGFTWGNLHYASIGMVGKRLQRLYWNRLGYSRDRVFRFVMSEPIKCVIVGADLLFESE